MRFDTQTIGDWASARAAIALVSLATLMGCGGSQSRPTTPTAAPASPTPTPTVVVASGELSLLRGAFVDFDAGAVVSATSPDAEVVFYTDTSASLSVWGGLLVRNGALLGIFGRALPPGKAGCSAAGATAPNSNVEVARLTAGTYLCVRTTLNRYSQVKILTEAGPSAGPLLVIAFETYQ